MSNLIKSNRKIQFLYNALVSDYAKSETPQFANLIKAYLEYLDTTYITNSINILKNNDVNNIYPNMLDDYLSDHFNGIIDQEKYSITDLNKRFFLAFSKIINNLKGNIKSFDFIFRSLSDFVIADDSGDVSVDKIAIEYNEDETWWNPTVANYYNGLISYNGSENYNASFYRGFTYQFTVDQDLNAIIELLKNVHPAGFAYELITQLDFSDEQDIDEELETNTTYYFYYDDSKTVWNYDGTIKYSGSLTYNDIF